LRTLLTLVFASFVSITLIPSSGHAAPEIDSIHFLIPGGAGGGWDGTARGTGEALTKSGLVGTASFLMVNSTPIVVRSLTKVFPQSFRDLTPVAGTIADYGAFVVRADSPIKSWKDVVAGFKENPRKMKFAGGSSKGSLDHLVPAAAIKAEGLDPKALRYIPYDAGGKAMAGLLSGEAQLLSTGLGEALEMSKAGQVRILAITAPERLKDAPDVPTLVEMGNPTVFANWRGFFGAPGLSKAEAKAYADVLGKMYQTPEWETVRARNGWVNVYKPGDEFYNFLEEQEKQVGDLMRELGFL
jgi:putative tricarboxylic transport membrane protein